MTAVGNSSTNLNKHPFALSIWALLTLWTYGDMGQEKRRSPLRTRVLHTNTAGERLRFRGDNLFSQQINKPSTERRFSSPQDVVSLSSGRESRRGGRASVTLEDRGWLHVISPLWVRCCWENTIILNWESPCQCSLRRTRILVGVLAQSVEDSRSPVRKWWEKMMISVTVLTSGPWSTAKWTCRNVFQKEEKQGRSSWTHNNQPLL